MDKMDTKKIIEFIEMLRKLPEEKQVELYYMIKGAAFIAEQPIKGVSV